MDVLKSLAMAFSCFSRIPMPRIEWEQRSMRYLMACFPLVGAVVGAAVACWCGLAGAFGFGSTLCAVGIVAMPIAVTGGIHLDGFADVVDALSSHADIERKRAILKDPHVGAFAVIGVALYLLAYFGVASEMPRSWQVVALVACSHVMTRCMSAFATVVMKGQRLGMLATFKGSADGKSLALIAAQFIVIVVAMAAIALLPALAALAGGLACLALLQPFARRNFGGMSGDVAGFFLQVCELVAFACIVFCAKAVGL